MRGRRVSYRRQSESARRPVLGMHRAGRTVLIFKRDLIDCRVQTLLREKKPSSKSVNVHLHVYIVAIVSERLDSPQERCGSGELSLAERAASKCPLQMRTRELQPVAFNVVEPRLDGRLCSIVARLESERVSVDIAPCHPDAWIPNL